MKLRNLLILSLALLVILPAHAVEYTRTFSVVVSPDTSPSLRAGLERPWSGKAFYAQSQDWLFYRTGGSCEGSSVCLFVACSGDHGVSWSKTNLNVRSTNKLYSATTNGTHAFLVRYNASTTTTFNEKTMFRVGSLGTGCQITWQAEQTLRAAGGTGTATHHPTIAVDTNNQAFVAYVNVTASGSTKKPFIIRSSGTNYASWTEDTALSTTNREWEVDVAKMTAGKMIVSYWDDNDNEDLLTRVYDGSWGSEVDANSRKVDSEAHLFTDADTVYAFYHDDVTSDVEMVSRSPLGTWSARETVTKVEATATLWTVTYEKLQRRFHLFYYNYTNNHISDLVGVPGGWPSSKVARLTTVGSNSSMTIASYEESAVIGGESFFGLFWTDNKNSGDPEVEATIVRVSPIPTTGDEEQLPALPFEVFTKPIAEALYQATNFVVQWPITFLLLGGTLVTGVLAHIKKRRIVRDLSLAGLAVIVGHWLIGNQPRLFGRYDISFLSPYSIREPPLTLTLFGVSSTALAFSLVILFVSGMGFLMAVGIALRD